MTSEIRWLFLLTALFTGLAMFLAGRAHQPQARETTAVEQVFGPEPPNFTTRRIPAREFLSP
jgi:hypothetical protein